MQADSGVEYWQGSGGGDVCHDNGVQTEEGWWGDSVRLRLQNIYGQNKWQLLAAAQVPHNGIDDVQEAYVVVAGRKGDTQRKRERDRERGHCVGRGKCHRKPEVRQIAGKSKQKSTPYAVSGTQR